jgi:hypothetical protein
MSSFFETYLQRAWSDSIDNVKIDDVRQAITEIKLMDDEHGAFWVGLIINNESILETNKDMSLIAAFEDAPETPIKRQCKTWEEIEYFYSIFLTGNLEELKVTLSKPCHPDGFPK